MPDLRQAMPGAGDPPARARSTRTNASTACIARCFTGIEHDLPAARHEDAKGAARSRRPSRARRNRPSEADRDIHICRASTELKGARPCLKINRNGLSRRGLLGHAAVAAATIAGTGGAASLGGGHVGPGHAAPATEREATSRRKRSSSCRPASWTNITASGPAGQSGRDAHPRHALDARTDAGAGVQPLLGHRLGPDQ